MTRRRIIGVVLAVGVTTILVGALLIRRCDHVAPATAAATVSTAKVTRADLASTQLVNATLGFAPSPPVIVRRQGTYTALPAEGALIEPGQPLAFVDDRPSCSCSA